MYCKFCTKRKYGHFRAVLIVAKCIVNLPVFPEFQVIQFVLIVAKCIVNIGSRKLSREMNIVLIVAKCIVNRK